MESDNIMPIEAGAKTSEILGFTPLSPTFGALVSGLDFSKDPPEPIKAALKQALFDYQVLLFRRQDLTEDQQVRFAQIFGTCRALWQSSHYPSRNKLTHYLSNVDTDGKAVGSHPDPDSSYWHTDGSWSQKPARATVLYGMQVPEAEGATHFANMYQIYEDLDQSTKDRLKTLQAEHNLELTRAYRHRRMPWQWGHSEPNRHSVLAQLKWWKNVLAQRIRKGAVCHPVVRPHPETGRPALFIGDHAWRITGKVWPIGIRLMKELNGLEINSAAIYTHNWQPGDLLIWDNGSVLHRVGTYNLFDHVRIMRRCVVES